MKTLELQQDALSRARNGVSVANYTAILTGFASMGIDERDIHPRENVFTYNAWRALGRQVRKGEHGVRVCTFAPVSAKVDPSTGETLRPGMDKEDQETYIADADDDEPVRMYAEAELLRAGLTIRKQPADVMFAL